MAYDLYIIFQSDFWMFIEFLCPQSNWDEKKTYQGASYAIVIITSPRVSKWCIVKNQSFLIKTVFFSLLVAILIWLSEVGIGFDLLTFLRNKWLE